MSMRVTLLAIGAASVSVGALADFIGLGQDVGLGLTQLVLVGVGVGFSVAGLLWSRFREVARQVSLILATYVILEGVASMLFFFNVLEPPDSLWVFEESGKTVHFDAIRGYTLTGIPSRYTRITRGTVEYIGVIKGNNHGFPDRDDFEPARLSPFERRFAVFGDSFSSAQFIEYNWPDRAERISRAEDRPLELLNFSIDGGGLANWWSILTRFVIPNGYDLDGVVFAVYDEDGAGGDLQRTFSVAEDRGQSRHLFGRTASWDPRNFPATLDQARAHMSALDGYIVSEDTFELALDNKWLPDKPLSLYFARKFNEIFNRTPSQNVQLTQSTDSLAPGAVALTRDMDSALRSRRIPVIVVHVPSRKSLLALAASTETDTVPESTKEFARILGADLFDGAKAFEGYTQDQILEMWLPYDSHWGQLGSDRFATYLARILSQ